MLPGTLRAEITKSAIQLLHETASQAKDFPADQIIIPTKADSALLPQTLSWSYSLKETYIDGGTQFEYAGRKYSLKMGFDRGAYDSYVQNYKSLPVFIFQKLAAPKLFRYGIL